MSPRASSGPVGLLLCFAGRCLEQPSARMLLRSTRRKPDFLSFPKQIWSAAMFTALVAVGMAAMRPRLQPLLLRDAGQRGDIHIVFAYPKDEAVADEPSRRLHRKVWTSLPENERGWRARCRWRERRARQLGVGLEGEAGCCWRGQRASGNTGFPFRMMWPTRLLSSGPIR
jgi:hypothetical protein